MKKTILMLLVAISSTNIFATDGSHTRDPFSNLAPYKNEAYLIGLFPEGVIKFKRVETKIFMGVYMQFIAYNNGVIFKKISSSDPALKTDFHSDSTLAALLQKNYRHDEPLLDAKHILMLLKE